MLRRTSNKKLKDWVTGCEHVEHATAVDAQVEHNLQIRRRRGGRGMPLAKHGVGLALFSDGRKYQYRALALIHSLFFALELRNSHRLRNIA